MMEIKYKYVVEMPPVVDTKQNFLDKLKNKHASKIFEGKEFVMISPIFNDGKNEYAHLILDFDSHDASIARAFEEAQQMATYLKKYPHYFEITPHGVHVVFNVAVELQSIKLSDLREAFAKLSFSTLDYVSSFRDMPIFRIGSWRKPYTILPATKLSLTSLKNNQHQQGPLYYFEAKHWFHIWETMLLPKERIEGEAFIHYLTKYKNR